MTIISLKHIKFCKKVISDSDFDKILDKYKFLLEREANYFVKKTRNKISFKKGTVISANRSENIINAMKIMRKGIITINNSEKNTYYICWQTSISDIFFRAIISSLILSSAFYFYYSNNIVNTAILFCSLFLFTTIKNLIVLKLKIWNINNSVL